MKNGKFDGEGVYYDSEGGRYKGDWKNGLREGKGIQYNPQGDRYEG